MLLGDKLHNRSQVVRKIVLRIAGFAYSSLLFIIISSFVVLLSCLDLNPRVLLFLRSPPHPAAGRRSERVAAWSWLPMSGCLVLGCQVEPRHRAGHKLMITLHGLLLIFVLN